MLPARLPLNGINKNKAKNSLGKKDTYKSIHVYRSFTICSQLITNKPSFLSRFQSSCFLQTFVDGFSGRVETTDSGIVASSFLKLLRDFESTFL